MDSSQLQLSNQICFPIYSTSKLITKAYKPYLDQFGLTYPQYLVLLVLWEQDKISIHQITNKLLLDTNTLSPLLKRMEKMEILQRTRAKEDQRTVIIELTAKGRQLKTEALPIPEKLLGTLLSEEITLDKVIQLKDTLDELVKVLKANIRNTQ